MRSIYHLQLDGYFNSIESRPAFKKLKEANRNFDIPAGVSQTRTVGISVKLLAVLQQSGEGFHEFKGLHSNSFLIVWCKLLSIAIGIDSHVSG